MLAERGVSIVTDSGSSIRPEDTIAEKLNVTILPLDIIFFKDGEPVSVADLDLKPDEFYDGKIDVFEAGPVLGVHAGPGTVGVSFQKA